MKIKNIIKTIKNRRILLSRLYILYFILISSILNGVFINNTYAASTLSVDCTDIITTGIPQIECESLELLYNLTNGDNWINKTNWGVGNADDWFNIDIISGHVSKINLENNNIEGIIPIELKNLSNLTYLNFNNNKLVGEIPKELEYLTNLTYLNFNNNKLVGEIPKELGNLSTNLTILSIAGNQLIGEIPKELGNLSKLNYLNLAVNKLTGEIPKELGNLRNIQMIYLQVNRLSGIIPTELTNITFTGYALNLSSNNFSGKIPNFDKINVSKGVSFGHGFDIFGNKLTFSDIEPSYKNIIDLDDVNGTNELNGYDVAEQQTVDTNRTLNDVEVGDILTIIPELLENPSGNDSYKWFKDGVEIIGATDRVYTKINSTIDDSGLYTYEVTNSIIDELTLYSHVNGSGITVKIVDTTKPEITLIDGDLNILLNDTFTEPGNNCTDNYDVTCNVIISGDIVDTTTVGNYIIKYNATDASGNTAIQKTRIVNVILGETPLIILIGNGTITQEAGLSYIDQGAEYSDTEDGTGSLTASGIVDITTIGTYTLAYDYTDIQGNVATQVVRTVTIKDTTSPVITLSGGNEIYYIGAGYIEKGASCVDGYDQNCNVIITGTVNTNLIGTYIITYTAIDNSGNTVSLIRMVNVIKKLSHGGGPTKHMDVCNDTGGDFSGNYYDGKCGINPGKKEEEKTKKELENKKIEEKVEKEVIKEEKANELLKELLEVKEIEEKNIEIEKTKQINGEERKYLLKEEYNTCKTINNLLNEDYLEGYKTKLKDISNSKHKTLIERLEKVGVINGTKENLFEGNREVSRVEFLKIVLRSHCIEYRGENISELNFLDLDNTSWQAKVIKKSIDLGIAVGDIDEKGNKIFRADDVISSIEATKILLRMALIQKGEEPDTKYKDLEIEWHKKYVKQGEYLGVFNSEKDNYKFNPNDGINRNKTVEFLFKVIRLYR